jgi:hypothetical protein
MTALAQHDKALSFFVIIGVESPGKLPLAEGDNGRPRSKAFVAGIEKSAFEVANYLTEQAMGAHAPRTDVEAVYPLLAESISVMTRTTKTAPPAPVRAAFVFQHAATMDAIVRQQIAEQWIAYCKVDVLSLWPSIGRLFQLLQEKRRGHKARGWQFAVTTYALLHPSATRLYEEKDASADVRNWITSQIQGGSA